MKWVHWIEVDENSRFIWAHLITIRRFTSVISVYSMYVIIYKHGFIFLLRWLFPSSLHWCSFPQCFTIKCQSQYWLFRDWITISQCFFQPKFFMNVHTPTPSSILNERKHSFEGKYIEILFVFFYLKMAITPSLTVKDLG